MKKDIKTHFGPSSGPNNETIGGEKPLNRVIVAQPTNRERFENDVDRFLRALGGKHELIDGNKFNEVRDLFDEHNLQPPLESVRSLLEFLSRVYNTDLNGTKLAGVRTPEMPEQQQKKALIHLVNALLKHFETELKITYDDDFVHEETREHIPYYNQNAGIKVGPLTFYPQSRQGRVVNLFILS